MSDEELIRGVVEEIEKEKNPAKKIFIFDDKFNANFFTELYKNDFVWCNALGGWFYYDLIKWRQDRTDRIVDFAMKAVDLLREKGKNENNQVLSKHASRCGHISRIHAITNLARSFLAKEESCFDADENLFNCKNGTFNLENNTFSPCSPTDYITKNSNIFYDPEAGCPQWINFINEIMLGRKDLVDFLQKALGYALTASAEERCFFILYGSTGDNGKSTLLETILHLWGEYAKNTPIATIIDKKNAGIPNDIARLRGARIITSKEPRKRIKIDEGLIKELTGNDTVSARFLNREFFDFRACGKIFIATNHKPQIAGTDNAIWNRIRLIPFDLSLSKDKIDRKLPEKLKEESSGIFNWILEGHRKWKEEGLESPEIIKQVNNEYREEEDEIGLFIKDYCYVEENISEQKNCYVSVTSFKEQLNKHTGVSYGQKRISEYMTSRGFKPKNNTAIIDNKKVRVYFGIKIQHPIEGHSNERQHHENMEYDD